MPDIILVFDIGVDTVHLSCNCGMSISGKALNGNFLLDKRI